MIRQIKRDSLSALVVSERDIAGIFALPGADGIENLVFHQLEIACLAAKQRKKFIASVASYETQIYGRKIQHI